MTFKPAIFGSISMKQIPLILYGSANYFERTNVVAELLPEGVGGFTTQMKNRIVVPFDGSYEELRHVLHHELVHGFQTRPYFRSAGGFFHRRFGDVDALWFAEGMAEFLSSRLEQGSRHVPDGCDHFRVRTSARTATGWIHGL